jgi:hypothetical protein
VQGRLLLLLLLLLLLMHLLLLLLLLVLAFRVIRSLAAAAATSATSAAALPSLSATLTPGLPLLRHPGLQALLPVAELLQHLAPAACAAAAAPAVAGGSCPCWPACWVVKVGSWVASLDTQTPHAAAGGVLVSCQGPQQQQQLLLPTQTPMPWLPCRQQQRLHHQLQQQQQPRQQGSCRRRPLHPDRHQALPRHAAGQASRPAAGGLRRVPAGSCGAR